MSILTRNLPIVLLAATLASPGACAQSTEPLKAVVFTLRNLSGKASYDEYEELITDAVRIEVENAGYEVVQGWEGQLTRGEQAPVHGPRASEIARALSANIAVTGFYDFPAAQSIALSIQCWDTAGETLLASFTISEDFGLSFYNFLHERMVDLVGAAERFTGPPRIEAIEVAAARGLGTIRFRSEQEGVEVLLAGGTSLGVISGGELVAPVGMLAAGSELDLELRLAGSHSASIAVTAVPEVQLPTLARAHRFTGEAVWNTGQPVGAGGAINWFPVPDFLFVGAQAYLGAQLPIVSGSYAVLHLDLGLRAGVYVTPLEPSITLFGAKLRLPVRVGFAIGAGLLGSLSLSTHVPVWLDAYVTVPQPFIEFGTKDVVVTLRLDQRYSLGLPWGALPLGWIERYVPKSSEDPNDQGYRTSPPVMLGVTFKW